MKKLLAVALLLPVLTFANDPGFGIPTKKWFLGFGDSPIFTGLRFNFKDQNVEKVNGVSFTIWHPNNDDGDGVVNGISVGVPLSGGTAQRNGINLGVAGISANDQINGLTIGGFGAGAGESMTGINLAGIGMGAGEKVSGINLAGIGVGSGGTVSGLNFGGIGVGAGDELKGINLAGIGIGSGGDVKGLNIGGIGVGAGDDITGISIGGIGMGAGGNAKGINIGGIGVGAGESLVGLNVALVGVGSPKVKGISMAAVVGGTEVTGIALAPAWVKIGEKDSDSEAQLKGASISAFNQIRGKNNGVSIGILNMSEGGKGFQIGLLNHNPNNPKGLRWLPFFNANFSKD
jgi:hypothetical protein